MVKLKKDLFIMWIRYFIIIVIRIVKWKNREWMVNDEWLKY